VYNCWKRTLCLVWQVQQLYSVMKSQPTDGALLVRCAMPRARIAGCPQTEQKFNFHCNHKLAPGRLRGCFIIPHGPGTAGQMPAELVCLDSLVARKALPIFNRTSSRLRRQDNPRQQRLKATSTYCLRVRQATCSKQASLSLHPGTLEIMPSRSRPGPQSFPVPGWPVQNLPQ
jgi:hypothetical protein